jgi:hypothetical protein
VLAAVRLYLYCTKEAGDPTINLWSSLMFAQLQLLAAQVFITSAVLSRDMATITTNFGSAICPTAPVHSATYRLADLPGGNRVESQPETLSFERNSSCEGGGDGESQRHILVTRSYVVQ